MLARRWFALSLVLLVLVGLATPFSSAQSAYPPAFDLTPVASVSRAGEFVPGQLIVRLRDESRFMAQGVSSLAAFQARFPRMGITAAQAIVPGAFRLDVGSAADIPSLARQLAANPDVLYAEPNYRLSLLRTINDPLSTFQYALNKIDAYGAWDVTIGSSAITVAVVDSGVNASHPDLAGRVLPGYDFLDDDTDASDEDGHGTLVAGIIGAGGDNGQGVAGMCWQCRILPVRVVNADGATAQWVADGIRYAVDHGARVINLSLGAERDSSLIHEQVRYAVQKNVLVVAAAGNSADEGNPVNYPAAYDEVIAVGATDENDRRASFSEVQPYVDLSAPGWNIAGTGHPFDMSAYSSLSGTSFSSPYVAGLAALLLSVNPGMDINGQRSILSATADDLGPAGPDWEFGVGRINAARAVAAVRIPAFDPVANPNQPDVLFFPETQHTLRGALRRFWEQNGGLPVFGFPISEELSETSSEGTFTVQYFERNRLELHPENPAPYDVLLGRLSDSLLQRQGRNWFTFPKGKETDGCQFFAETGHTVCEPFLSYWKANGLRDPNLSGDGRSVALFGLPLSEPAEERNASGESVLTQWFERARFEFHPNNASDSQVLLGLLGVETARPAPGSPAGSGQTPPDVCQGVPPSVDATVKPSGCILYGTVITIDATGFEPGEEIAFFISGANGEMQELESLEADGAGQIRGLQGSVGLPNGFWALVMHGNESDHESVVYLKILDR